MAFGEEKPLMHEKVNEKYAVKIKNQAYLCLILTITMAEKEPFNAILCSTAKYAYFSIVMRFFFGFWQTMNAVHFRFI